jgi:hypothetical protein
MADSAIPGEAINLQIADLLREVKFPINKDGLVEIARDAGVDNELLAMLDGLPEQDYAEISAITPLLAGNFGPGLST